MSKREDPRIARADHEWLHRAQAQGFNSERDMYQSLHLGQCLTCGQIGERVGGFSARHIAYRMGRWGLKPIHWMRAADKRWDQHARGLGFASERDMLTSLYRGYSMRQIGEMLGVTASAVKTRIHLAGIKPRPRGGANYHGREEVRA